MDTTETYIKMCDCLEIQEACKYRDGDSFYDPSVQTHGASDERIAVLGSFIMWGDTQVTSGGYDYDLYEVDWSKLIWLPDQAQLQEMVWVWVCERRGWKAYTAPDRLHYLTYSVNEFYHSVDARPWETMEQLTIAYLMCEMHGKVWTTEGWKPQGEDNGRTDKEINRQGIAEDETGAEGEGRTETGLDYVHSSLTRERA